MNADDMKNRMKQPEFSEAGTPLKVITADLWHVTCTLQANAKFQTAAQTVE